MDINLLIAFALGFVAAAGKDLLQSYIIRKQLVDLGRMDKEDEMTRMMDTVERVTKGFALNTPKTDDEDEVKQQEPYYKSYFS